jgi:hypothetical protein
VWFIDSYTIFIVTAIGGEKNNYSLFVYLNIRGMPHKKLHLYSVFTELRSTSKQRNWIHICNHKGHNME